MKDKRPEKKNKENKKLRKELQGIRCDLGDLYNTLNELVEKMRDSNAIWEKMGTTGAVANRYPITLGAPEEIAERQKLQEKWEAQNNPDVPGSPENPIVDEFNLPPDPSKWGPVDPTLRAKLKVKDGVGYSGVHPGDGYATAPGDLATNPMGGEPVRVDEVTPNLDKEASPYTFWFTPEELERLGIADMSYHLEEVPGREGRLRIVQGPPTQLLPGHEELVREKMEGEKNE